MAGTSQPCKDAKSIKEQTGYNDWQIEINTLEELMGLQNEVGQIIIDGEMITIYDDYIE
jgi:hypothetical protein